MHNNFFYVERTVYPPKGSVIALPMVSIWRSSILFVVGEQNFCFQKLEIYLLFLKPWQFLFPEGKWKSILDGVHWIWVWVGSWMGGWMDRWVGGDQKVFRIFWNSVIVISKLCWFQICNQKLSMGIRSKVIINLSFPSISCKLKLKKMAKIFYFDDEKYLNSKHYFRSR